MSLDFTKSKEDYNLYFNIEGGRPMILMSYVYDLSLTCHNELVVDVKRRLATEFKVKYLGMMHYSLGMEVWQSVDGVFLGQGKYAVEILKRFRMMQGNGHTYGI